MVARLHIYSHQHELQREERVGSGGQRTDPKPARAGCVAKNAIALLESIEIEEAVLDHSNNRKSQLLGQGPAADVGAQKEHHLFPCPRMRGT